MSSLTRILVVDDNPMNLEMLQRRLSSDGYRVITAASGAVALVTMQEIDVDLVILDMMMPEMDGYTVLQKIKSDPGLKHIPVIIASAHHEEEQIVRCIEAGADDYLPKPINSVLLRARVNSSLSKKRLQDNERHYRQELEQYNERLKAKVQHQVSEITSAQMAAIFATSKLAESKDPETGAHLERLRMFCRIIATDLARFANYAPEITPEFIDCIYAASPLHDIGKVGIPDKILLKPERLTDDEWKIMRTHTLIGASTLRAVAEKHPGNNFIHMGIQIAESHHEKWDGSGYPHGLRGDAIPLAARILALADVYDALTSERCYKRAFSHAESRQIILEGAGKHFDPAIVQAFLRCETTLIDVKQQYRDDAAAELLVSPLRALPG
jgi:putative two-component system response regulator